MGELIKIVKKKLKNILDFFNLLIIIILIFSKLVEKNLKDYFQDYRKHQESMPFIKFYKWLEISFNKCSSIFVVFIIVFLILDNMGYFKDSIFVQFLFFLIIIGYIMFLLYFGLSLIILVVYYYKKIMKK